MSGWPRYRRSLRHVSAFGVGAALALAPAADAPASPPVPPGEPVPDSVRVLDVTAPDPDGGLPFGVRTWWTTRDRVCRDAGRVQDGRLGDVGPDGRFTERGLDTSYCTFPAERFWAVLSPRVPGRTVYAGQLGPGVRRVDVVRAGTPQRVATDADGWFIALLGGPPDTSWYAPHVVARFDSGCDGARTAALVAAFHRSSVDGCDVVWDLGPERYGRPDALDLRRKRDRALRIRLSARVRREHVELRFRLPFTIQPFEGYRVRLRPACGRPGTSALHTRQDMHRGTIQTTAAPLPRCAGVHTAEIVAVIRPARRTITRVIARTTFRT